MKRWLIALISDVPFQHIYPDQSVFGWEWLGSIEKPQGCGLKRVILNDLNLRVGLLNTHSTWIHRRKRRLEKSTMLPGARLVWFCCNCGDGPFIIASCLICQGCDHTSCSTCYREFIKTLDYRESSASTGIAQQITAGHHLSDSSPPFSSVANNGNSGFSREFGVDKPSSDGSVEQLNVDTLPGPSVNSIMPTCFADEDEQYKASMSEEVFKFHHMPSALQAFAEDPSSYAADILSLSRRVLSLNTQTFQDIELIDGQQHIVRLPKSSISDSSDDMTYTMTFQHEITSSMKVLSAIIAGVRLLEDEGFTASGYSIITHNAVRPKVLTIMPVSMPTLAILSDLLQEVIQGAELSNQQPALPEIMKDILDILSHVISTLGLGITVHISSLVGQWQTWQTTCHLLISILKVLHLALLTFIRSHLDVTDHTTSGSMQSTLKIQTIGGNILMAPRQLRCLDGFLKQPVWTFSFQAEDSTSAEYDVDGFYLSTYLRDFAELWGPIKLDCSKCWDPYTSLINVRGGNIRSRKSDQHPTWIKPLENEVLCHWVDWLEPQLEGEPHAIITIDTSKRLLVGGNGFDQTASKVPEVNVSFNCQCSDRYSLRHEVFELRTRMSSWNLDAKSLQTSAGKYVTVNLGLTYKFDAGWTMKDVILEDWIDSEAAKTDQNHYPKPHYLDIPVVLDVSCCTGNARRISLWNLLNHPSVLGYLRRNLTEDFCLNLDSILGRLPAMSRIASIWLSLHKDGRSLLIVALRFILGILRCTGVGKDKLLQAWDITDVERVDGRKINPRWTSILRDDTGCATFAIITATCVEYRPSTFWPCNGKLSEGTILNTQFCFANKNLKYKDTTNRPVEHAAEGYDTNPFRKDENATFSSKWGVKTTAENSAADRYGRPVAGNQPDVEIQLHERIRARQSARSAHRSVRVQSSKTYSMQPNELPTNPASIPPLGNKKPPTNMLYEPSDSVSQNGIKFLANQSLGNFQFVDGRGKKVGRLVSETSVNIGKLSSDNILPLRWEPYDLGILGLIHEKEKALDKRVGTWAQRSTGFIPWVVNRFMPEGSTADIIPVTENLRQGTLDEGQKVFQAFVW
ncbi:hypothetical protein ACMFMG_002752 [Clarireedia jacksonii]